MRDIDKRSDIWKPVIGYKGIYQVSCAGEIRSMPRIDARGHHRRGRMKKVSSSGMVALCKDGKETTMKISRVVYFAFNGLPENPKLWEVHHIDGNTLNSALSNLELKPASAIQTLKDNAASMRKEITLTDGNKTKNFPSLSSASKQLGLKSIGQLTRIKSGEECAAASGQGKKTGGWRNAGKET